ncbi:MAG: hypothetical protein HGA75_09880 [Thiobacillus sp.]|nr:hypothetical protein [Thiobacillus sp.]
MRITKGQIVATALAAIGAIAGLGRFVTEEYPTLFFPFIGLLALVLLVSGVLYAKANMPGLKALPRRPTETLEDEVGDAKEIWMSMHSGSVKLAHGDLTTSSRKVRVVLTHPDDQALKSIEKVGGGATAVKMAIDIRELTTELKRVGKQVRWFKGPIGNSLLIVDPESESAWARIEVLVPFGPAAERPGLRASKEKSPEVYGRFKSAFNALWEASVEPED